VPFIDQRDRSAPKKGSVMLNALATASIGRPINRLGFSFFPVYIHAPRPDVVAAQPGVVSVTELPHAEVPTVQFVNTGGRKVLVPSGMVIEGGHQNRVVNVPVIMAGGSTLEVPVSCVQAGRWGGGQEFRFARSVATRRVRRTNVGSTIDNMRQGSKQANQSLIWNSVASELQGLGVNSASSNLDQMHEVWERDERRHDALRELVALGPLPEQCGIVVSHGRRAVSADIFGDRELLGAHYEALVTAALLEAGAVAEGSPSVSAALRFVQRIAKGAGMRVPGTGLGTEVHIETNRVVGQTLLLDEALVYASCFALAA
jgi:hypothetical protein